MFWCQWGRGGRQSSSVNGRLSNCSRQKASDSANIIFVFNFIILVKKSSVFQFAFQKYKIKIYRTVILAVVLYGCETWSLTLREERRLRVFENRVLRRVFGPKRDEVTGEWRKLHSEELNDQILFG